MSWLRTASSGPGTATIGGKAAGLYALRQLGVAVPPFAVLPAEVFDHLLQDLPATTPAELTARGRHLLSYTPTPAEKAALRAELQAWDFPNRPVVVRSSVADEDGRRHSFAGQMDSFLHLHTEADVWAAVTRCAASAYSERAQAYRRQHGLPPAARPAVVVQQQVAAHCSGVLLSTWPEYPPDLAIHAVAGFGDALVSGQADPDEFYLRKSTGQLMHQRLAVAGAAPCLPPPVLQALHELGQRLEQAWGHPQDVEFVLATDQQLWVVQARPLTQPVPEVLVFDNANIQESYCGVTTPLTFSFARRAYATVYRQTMRTLGVPAAEVAALEPVVGQLLALVQGRIYYHINHWYQGLLLLPAFRQNKDDMERMMGLEEPVDFVQPPRHGLWALARRAPRQAANLLRLLGAFAGLKRAVPAFQARMAAATQRFQSLPLATLDGAALRAELRRLDDNLLSQWTTPIVNDFRVMMDNGRVLRGLRAAGAPHPDELLRRYLSADQQLASVQPVYRLQALAAQARQRPPLAALVAACPPNVAELVAQDFPAFGQAAAAFVAEFGDRTVGELKLETATMRTDARIFYQYLGNLLAAAPAPSATSAPAPQDDAVGGAAAREMAALLAGVGRLQRWALARSLRRLQEAIRHREALRLERTRLFGMYRSLYRAAGHLLVQQGRLTQPQDVFFLTETEIAAALGGPSAPPEAGHQPAPGVWLRLPTAPLAQLPTAVAARRAEFAAYGGAEVPARVMVPPPPYAPAAAPLSAAGVLQGTGCFPGVATGQALVVRQPEDDLRVAGKVVCALRTDPGWAVLFPACRAVAIERGSSLSHSVIVLRELGIPTIINVPGLTRHISSGQPVQLDGQTGTLTLLPAPDAEKGLAPGS